MHPPQDTQDSATTVHHWAAELLERAHHTGDIPPAGSATWSQLNESDPRKTAAVVRAALAWLHEGTREAITSRLQTELDLLDRIDSDRTKATALDLAGTADWRQIAAGPTQRELHRRRHHRTCPACSAALGWADTRCACGWTEPTPTETRTAARWSWARYETTTETAA